MPNPDVPSSRPLVLIVDDDVASRLLMGEALEQAGFEVVEAEDGALGVQTFSQRPSDIVLMDVEMPNMDGFSACAALRRLPQGVDIPILMVTGHDDVQSVHHAFEVGATDFLSKPINWALLAYRVRYLLRSSGTYHQLKASEFRLAKAQHLARLGHWDWNVGANRWQMSDEIYRIFGFAKDGIPPNREAMVAAIHPEDRERVIRAFDAALHEDAEYDVEYRLVLPDGTRRVVAEQIEVSFNSQSQPEYVEGTLQDFTERRQVEAKIRYLAYYDGLTGLPNRQMFSEQVTQALRHARRTTKPLALLFLDVDNFKSVNDSLGHSTGDEMLRQVADRLSVCTRSSDFISRPTQEASEPALFRVGGDEFTVLVADLQQEQDASLIARRIMNAVSKPFLVDGYELFATVSIGIAVHPSDGDDVRTLLRNADSAMYQAKVKGKNTFEFYTESLTQLSIERMKMEAKLRRAIEQGELQLYYQPKIDAQTGRLAGAEALLRWNTSGLGTVSPTRFIRLAEETGLIIPIGDWVLREACRQIQVWDAIGMPPTTVAVNVSARQFQYCDLVKMVSELLDETGVRAQSLELEVTESAIITDVPRAKVMLQKLSDLGVRISIDDFGTGYSSLSQLRWLPIDGLKIDRSFIKDLPQDQDDSAITLAILAMARNLGLRVVAEGIESEAQFAFLKQNGCDQVQGYLFSPGVPAAEFTHFFGDAVVPMRRLGSE